MKKLMITLLVLFVFSVPAYAQMGMMGSQQGQMGQGMKGERQMMDCPMQQMSGQGMMQCGQSMMGQGMMGGMMGMGREGMGYRFNQWFKHGVTLILENSAKLKLKDEQKSQLDNLRRKY